MTSIQNRSTFGLILLLLGAILFGIAIPVGITQEIIIPGFFPGGEFSSALISTWDQGQKIGAIVLLVFVVVFTIFCIYTVIRVIQEFSRRKHGSY